MKKTILFVAFLSLLSGLAAREVYVSNGLGQKIRPEEGLSSHGWELVVDGDVSFLYENGDLFSTREDRTDGYTVRYTDHMVVVHSDEDGRILRRIDGDTETNYFYEGRLLSSVNTSVSGVVVRKVEYIRSSDGMLLAYRDGDISAFVSGSVLVHSSEDGLVVYGEDYVVEKTVVDNPDGGYTEDDGVSRKTYDGNGRLVLEERVDHSIVYSYGEDGKLLETRRTDEEGILITTMENGRAASTKLYGHDGVIRTDSRILSDGTIEETRYIAGVARYRFHFDRDGKRVLEAVGL